jgi:hypothetical protein
VNPRQEPLKAIYHIYAYLKCHEQSTMVFDDNLLRFTSSNFPEFDLLDFYGDVKEAIPSNVPEPNGNPVQMNIFLALLIYLNRAPISWYSKAPRTIETLTFGSEFIALRIAVE